MIQKRHTRTIMAQEKKFVEEITSMNVDFTQWYTDVIKKADRITSYNVCYTKLLRIVIFIATITQVFP